MVLVAAVTCPFEMTLELPVVVVDRASLAHGIPGQEARSIRSAPARFVAREPDSGREFRSSRHGSLWQKRHRPVGDAAGQRQAMRFAADARCFLHRHPMAVAWGQSDLAPSDGMGLERSKNVDVVPFRPIGTGVCRISCGHEDQNQRQN